ncbi:hypothetical protein BC827DRAFT_1273394 [Russula dissimulans]|nr:hypothetical protein BC827DRAFT_1273394 [Russula dissimulans]
MSNFPMAQSPQEIVASLIHLIETAESSSYKLNLTMALATLTRNEKFIDHLASISFTDHETATPPPIDHSSSLTEIKLSLSSLVKAVSGLQTPPLPVKPANHHQLKNPLTLPQENLLSNCCHQNPQPQCGRRSVSSLNPPKERPSLALISATLNAKLPPLYSQKVHIAAVCWTAWGNLIITAGPSTPSKVLHEASPHIGSIIHKAFRQDSSAPSPPVRPNVRWSKLLIHGVPTNASESQGPSNPDECHEALLATNPSYSSLLITRKPSWVCSPSSYQSGSVSSLVVAFEDPDGSTLRSLLQSRHLYIFGTQAKASETSDKEDINIILDPPTPSHPVAPTSLRPQARTPVAPLVATAPKPTNRHDRPPTFSPPTTRSTRK